MTDQTDPIDDQAASDALDEVLTGSGTDALDHATRSRAEAMAEVADLLSDTSDGPTRQEAAEMVARAIAAGGGDGEPVPAPATEVESDPATAPVPVASRSGHPRGAWLVGAAAALLLVVMVSLAVWPGSERSEEESAADSPEQEAAVPALPDRSTGTAADLDEPVSDALESAEAGGGATTASPPTAGRDEAGPGDDGGPSVAAARVAGLRFTITVRLR